MTWPRRAIAAEEKKNKKKTQSQKKESEKSIFPTSETPKKILRRCLARLQNLGHSQKKKNNRVATATKLRVACPKTPSKVRVLGARELCAPQPQRKGAHAQKRTKKGEQKQNTHKQQRRGRRKIHHTQQHNTNKGRKQVSQLVCTLRHNSKVPASRELGLECTPQQHTKCAQGEGKRHTLPLGRRQKQRVHDTKNKEHVS